MSYQKCNKCGKEMCEITEQRFSNNFDGVEVIFECECGNKCQCTYNYEHVTPDNVFWEEEKC